MTEIIKTKETNQPAKLKEAIVLAGGLGTRLRSVVNDLPKAMAPVNDQPFLKYVIRYLLSQGIEYFVFSLGYKHEVIESFLQKEFPTIKYRCVIEDEPLGTGGGIQLACKAATQDEVLIVNADTIFKINIAAAFNFHRSQNAYCTLALKPMKDFDRYGVVEIDKENIVTNFKEKQFYTEGLINGGVYILNRNKFLSGNWPEKFSFEKDFLEKEFVNRDLSGFIDDGYFIDIGIPEDFAKAQTELKQPELNFGLIDKTWTLFLDRDGVLNEDKIGSYIFSIDELKFYEGVPKAVQKLTEKFGRIILATNQRGVGKKLMTEEALKEIHQYMLQQLRAAGGNIDAIYYGTSVYNDDYGRKPNPGMAFQAKADHPEIDLSRSIMVGNNLSDMRFGRNAGMFCVYLTTTNPPEQLPHPDIDVQYASLVQFANAL